MHYPVEMIKINVRPAGKLKWQLQKCFLPGEYTRWKVIEWWSLKVKFKWSYSIGKLISINKIIAVIAFLRASQVNCVR